MHSREQLHELYTFPGQVCLAVPSWPALQSPERARGDRAKAKPILISSSADDTFLKFNK